MNIPMNWAGFITASCAAYISLAMKFNRKYAGHTEQGRGVCILVFWGSKQEAPG